MDTWPCKQNMQRAIIHILGFFIDKETEYLKISPEKVFFYIERLYFSLGAHITYPGWFRFLETRSVTRETSPDKTIGEMGVCEGRDLGCE